MSTASSAPVIASKPVAKTIASNSKLCSRVAIPLAVIETIGSCLMSTTATLGLLNVW